MSATSTPGGLPERLDGVLGALQANVVELDERFWSKVDVGGPDDCWEWQAVRLKGYGRFSLGGKMQYAHRLVIGLLIGDEGCALHSCDNPPCVNPAHLSVGTHQDNMTQRDARGRQVSPPGEGNGMAKLTDSKVLEIRARYATGLITQRALGEEYGVSQTVVSLIVRREIWGHLPNEQDNQ